MFCMTATNTWMRSETYMSKTNLQRGKLTVENRKSREKKRICFDNFSLSSALFLPFSVVRMTACYIGRYTPVLSVGRQLTTWQCWRLLLSAVACCSNRSISPVRRAAATGGCYGTDRQTDRQTDTVALHRPCRSVSIAVAVQMWLRDSCSQAHADFTLFCLFPCI